MFQCHRRAIWLLTTEGMHYNYHTAIEAMTFVEKCGDLADGFCSWIRVQNLILLAAKKSNFCGGSDSLR